MKTLNKAIVLFLSSLLLFTFSCEKDDAAEIKRNKNVNEWIQSYMKLVYYWNNQMPTPKRNTVFPADYFESLLYKAEDRFSFITEDYTELINALGGVQMEAGYNFTLFLLQENSKDVVGIVNYIKPHSPASSSGLKRGDVFYTVNGKQLTVDNYLELMNKTSSQHTLGVMRNDVLQSISLSVTKYEENPVFLDSIYNIGGKNIAYLIYNFFASDKGDGSYTYLKELNDIFGKFKQANVNELVLDLRYNSGGEATVATALASMISNRSSYDLFCIDQYNSIVDKELQAELGINYNKTFFDDNLIIRDDDGNIIDRSIPINKLELNRLYVLTSYHTASASELIINGLTPYMNVVLIGTQTYGKNVGMWLIYEQDTQKQKDNHWAMMPIVFKIYNSQNRSDYGNGFIPNIEFNEYEKIPMYPLGDTNEPLLWFALSEMGLQRASALRSAENRFISRPLASSIDRTPERKNIFHQKRSIAGQVIHTDDL